MPDSTFRTVKALPDLVKDDPNKSAVRQLTTWSILRSTPRHGCTLSSSRQYASPHVHRVLIVACNPTWMARINPSSGVQVALQLVGQEQPEQGCVVGSAWFGCSISGSLLSCGVMKCSSCCAVCVLGAVRVFRGIGLLFARVASLSG